MARVSNRVDPESLEDLLAAPPRASLAWIHAERPAVAPVRYAFVRGRHLVAVDDGPEAPRAGAPVRLVLDGGRSWFSLRAITVRGTLAPCSDPPCPDGSWLEVAPSRITGWHYGSLHEEPER